MGKVKGCCERSGGHLRRGGYREEWRGDGEGSWREGRKDKST